MRKDKYGYLREQYPEYVSKDQLYKICNVAKRTAKYLLDNGIIPCENNGKKTRKYTIALNDIIAYLQKRDKRGSMVPRGSVSSRHGIPRASRVSFSTMLAPGAEEEVKNYFAYIYESFPDTLTSHDVSVMTGLSRKTILELLKQGEIQTLIIGSKYVVPKIYLLNFVSSPRFVNMKSNSSDFIKILGGFEIWKTAKS